MMKMSVGYPNRADEKEILIRRELRRKDEVDVEVVSSPEKLIQMQQIIEKVHVDPAIMTYMVEIVTRTREDPRVLVGSSPRGSLALQALARPLGDLRPRLHHP
jgi:MoxR-like ATPase